MEDIEIARNTNLENIMAISEKAGIAEESVGPKITCAYKGLETMVFKRNHS